VTPGVGRGGRGRARMARLSRHAHIVVGRADGSARGGHLLEGHVWPTLEVVVEKLPRHLRRRTDPETGLALIDLGDRARAA